MTGTTAVRDGAALAVLSHRFEAIVRRMSTTLARSGRSGVLNTARDFSCCVLTAAGDVLMTGQSPPIHVMGGPDLQARSMLEFHPDVRAGDAFLHNSPYHGNTHAADHSILVPVVDDAGVHRFTVLAKAHQADCGNSVPTTYMAGARDVYEEGALIFPVVKVQEDYLDRADVLRMCEMRIRVPHQWRGDYLAVLGSARIGERALVGLAEEVGWDELDAFAADWLDYSESRMAAAIAGLPAGRVVTTTRHDPFPGVPDGVPVRAEVSVDPVDRVIEIDLRDNPDCVPSGLNLSEASSRTAALIGVFNSIDHTVPHNQGSFRRVRVRLRENCVVGIPRHPVSCSVATTNLANRLGNLVQRAMADLGEGIGLAEVGTGMSPSEAVVSGVDTRNGAEPFVNQIFIGTNGGAGGPAGDGWLTMDDLGSGGTLLLDSVEIDELKQPIVIHERRLARDTEGAGRHRGAPGLHVEYGPVGCELEAIYANDGAINPMLGARGGLPGARSAQHKRDRAGELVELDSCGPVRVVEGERLVARTSGGGGYGPPHTRDPELVAKDVREGWVGAVRAHHVYRVVLDDHGQVDAAATAHLRDAAATAHLRDQEGTS
ncbi:hydantoinase B/oxoprolinase family protein [Actinosynnema sp. NPDC047251]|uniref:Hydantoinase B/oxoprolinase n=1 Tax=Saccharothrix espanaensis (strain ATCC 51144 / DSM 44229 / JCM 9112 / NBRC 15066 / NRRL 15764) TaxID=1179773 RepID=K0JW30_SACES|nr:hydantoinase B/oxoprolinase family protein [Saccharothrix espanaensis]CCH28408.1 Hydantoinase B/oxoprolinase [Saccharothrix espanaensis DSM 44229]